jgi:hypothetical protein
MMVTACRARLDAEMGLMIRNTGPSTITAALLACLGLCGCNGMAATGPLQPQTVQGPCQIKPFFLVGFSASPVQMTIDASGQACTFTMINPNLQAIQSDTLITRLPSHGQARAGLTNGSTSAIVSYTPAPGYTGPDAFTATIEPGDRAVAVTVDIRR